MNNANVTSLQIGGSDHRRRNFVERTLAGLVRRSEHALFAEELAQRDGLLQTLDPRVKIIVLLALIIDVTLSRNLFTILFIFGLGVMLAVWSQVPIAAMAKRAWLTALIFTGVIALPVIFITPGDVIAIVPFSGWTVTQQGVNSSLYLISRVETTATLSLLLVLCTRWTHIVKALRVLHLPVVFVVILGMTYRYIFVMLETARNMFEARQSRLVGSLDAGERRRLAAASVGVLLTKSFQLNTDVFMAMQSRGFRGEVYILDDFAMTRRDWLALAAFAALVAVAYWFGRQDSLVSMLHLHF